MLEQPRKFICDEMLKSLGHWLRIAGYDVLILPDATPDRVLIERARHDGRLLLTRDRKMNEFKAAADIVLLLDCNGLEDCVADLNSKLNIDWLLKPFSRCKLCNTELVDADERQIEKLPHKARESVTRVCYCPRCRQLFWDGSHVSRMRRYLTRWNQPVDPQ